jgi:hypothetical protein
MNNLLRDLQTRLFLKTKNARDRKAAAINDTADLAGLPKAADQAVYRSRVEILSCAAERASLRRTDELSIHKQSAA